MTATATKPQTQATPTGNQAPQVPSAPREWTLAQIQAALSRRLPANLLKTKNLDGNTIRYLPWHTANEILDKYAPGWTWEIVRLETSRDRIFLIGRLTLPSAEGNIYREATGTELLKKQQRNEKTGEIYEKEHSYGDPSSKAESMAFRRAAARFGLGMHLYQD